MSPEHLPDSDQTIEQEIRQGRTFSLADAIGKAAGDLLKGESPVPKLLQVKNEILNFIGAHLNDPAGALQVTLRELVQADDAVCSRHFEAPLNALAELIQALLAQERGLQEFVRQVDMKWGQLYGERPHFEQPGQPPHPEDEYTYASVRIQLTELLSAIKMQDTYSNRGGSQDNSQIQRLNVERSQ